MPATNSLTDCRALVTAVTAAQGRVPEVLANILAAADLLNAHRSANDPARAIVAASVDGTLTAEKLDELITGAARTQVVNTYLGELRQRSERMFVQAFHKALAAGACDELIDSLRPVWDEHVAAVNEARSQINAQSTAEHILETGDATLVACWQQLPRHLAALGRIVAVARQFGPRSGNHPMIKEYANSDGARLEDAAIWCANGDNLEADSAAFRRPGTHRQSPLFAVPLRLNTLAQARERYRLWASAQWESQHSGTPQRWIDDAGVAHDMPRQPNPFAEAAQ